MPNQEQDVSPGGTAIQSGRDTTIHQGLNAAQLKEIIETVASQLPSYAAIAREIVDARLVDFEQRIVGRFTTDSTTNSEAFKDPDFQYLLRNAQVSYSRSGEDRVGALLTDLIAERSKVSGRDRLALTLNQAVETSANLTVNEFSALAFAYLFRRTHTHNLSNVSAMSEALNYRIDPFIHDISKEPSCYEYLEAQRCITISMGSIPLADLLTGEYPALFTKGVPASLLEESVPVEALKNHNLFLPAIHNGENLQPNAIDTDVWKIQSQNYGLEPEASEKAWEIAKGGLMTRDEIISAYSPTVPRIKDAFEMWDETPIQSINLTAVGLAIGHAYATKSGFKADLKIWIK